MHDIVSLACGNVSLNTALLPSTDESLCLLPTLPLPPCPKSSPSSLLPCPCRFPQTHLLNAFLLTCSTASLTTALLPRRPPSTCLVPMLSKTPAAPRPNPTHLQDNFLLACCTTPPIPLPALPPVPPCHFPPCALQGHAQLPLGSLAKHFLAGLKHIPAPLPLPAL